MTMLVPLAGALKDRDHAPPLAVFLAGGVLAEWMPRATEEVTMIA